jgi:hypothetical protein
MKYSAYELMAFLATKRCDAEVVLKNTTTDAELKLDGLDEDDAGRVVLEVNVTEFET